MRLSYVSSISAFCVRRFNVNRHARKQENARAGNEHLTPPNVFNVNPLKAMTITKSKTIEVDLDLLS